MLSSGPRTFYSNTKHAKARGEEQMLLSHFSDISLVSRRRIGARVARIQTSTF